MSLVFVVLLSVVALPGCAGKGESTQNGESVPVTVVLTSGSPLADEPSSFIVRIASARSGEEVRATATKALTVEVQGLVLLEDELRPGRYDLEAEQRGCGMAGRDCPDDPSSAEFAPAYQWQCSVSFEVGSAGPTRIEIVEGPDPDVAEQRLCTVIG